MRRPTRQTLPASVALKTHCRAVRVASRQCGTCPWFSHSSKTPLPRRVCPNQGRPGKHHASHLRRPGPTRCPCASSASSPPSAVTWTGASLPRPPHSRDSGAKARWPADAARTTRPRSRWRAPAGPCASAAAPMATTRAAAAWKKSRPSGGTRTRFQRTGASCTGRSCRPTAPCSAGLAACPSWPWPWVLRRRESIRGGTAAGLRRAETGGRPGAAL